MATRKTKEDVRLERLIKVAEFMLQGLTQMEIAVQLGVSQTTISRDEIEVRDNWVKESQATVAELVATESQRLEYIIKKLMPDVESGKLGVIDRVLRVIELKMKLYGVESKYFVENMRDLFSGKADTDSDLGTLTDAVRELSAIFDKRGDGQNGGPAKKNVPPGVLN